MTTRVALFSAAVILLGCLPAVLAQQSTPAVPPQLKVIIDTQQTEDPVSKYIFGSFIEHIGSTIYRSLWAELLDDRKFYSPISSIDPQTPARGQGNPMRMQLRKWRPSWPGRSRRDGPGSPIRRRS